MSLMPIKQDNRLLAIKTVVGPSVLDVGFVNIPQQVGRLSPINTEFSRENQDDAPVYRPRIPLPPRRRQRNQTCACCGQGREFRICL